MSIFTEEKHVITAASMTAVCKINYYAPHQGKQSKTTNVCIIKGIISMRLNSYYIISNPGAAVPYLA